MTDPRVIERPTPTDRRLEPPSWRPGGIHWRGPGGRLLLLLNLGLAAWYLVWLLGPGRASHPVLYGLLVGAEMFNLVQGVGFWWTVSRITRHRPARRVPVQVPVDVLIPTYDEPIDIVEPTVFAARNIRGDDVRVVLLDDGGRAEMAEMARRHGVGYLHRQGSEGAKAGNVNSALVHLDAPFVAILDCDHVPTPDFLEVCLAGFETPDVAFVQTPQYYANHDRGGVAAASWEQQELFFGTIARGRDALDAMFCCGTNVVFRREALDEVGGFSLDSLTEDFELSVRLHEQGWTTRYVPEVVASGLGPEDMASYVSQQLRWARGCLSTLPRLMAARLPMRQRVQYLLSAAYWLTGWTLLVYMTFPVVRILTGEQPVAVSSPESFLVHWGPYFLASMVTVGLAAGGRYRWSAFALMSANFWIHVSASLLTLLRRTGSFAVTPKQGVDGRQVRPVLVPLAACTVLAVVAGYGLALSRSPATVTNVSFALVHLVVIASGIRFALLRARPSGGTR